MFRSFLLLVLLRDAVDDESGGREAFHTLGETDVPIDARDTERVMLAVLAPCDRRLMRSLRIWARASTELVEFCSASARCTVSKYSARLP